MNHSAIKTQSGLSLIELMVTLLIGLVISFAVGNMLMTSNRAALQNETLMEPQDNGRFLLSFLAKELRNSGRSGVAMDVNGKVYIEESRNFNPCVSNQEFCNNNSNSGGNQDNFGTGDRLAIIYRPGSSEAIDCAGDSDNIDFITAHPSSSVNFRAGEQINEEILNSYWVEKDDATGIHQFVCKSFRLQANGSWLENKTASTPLTYNIEAMHVLYGENLAIPKDSLGADIIPQSDEAEMAKRERVVDRYVTADQVSNWNNIYAVKVSFLVKSEEQSIERKERKYTLLDSEEYSFNDGYVRQIFSSTFALANYKTSSFLQ